MGVHLYTDEKIIEKLKSLSEKGLFNFGLVIAEKAPEHITVTHLAPLPSPAGAEDDLSEDRGAKAKLSSPAKPNSISSLVDSVVSIHARQIVRMLPGGLDVLGIYITTPSSELSTPSNQGKLRTILTAIHKATSKYYLGTSDSSLEKIVLFGCTQTSKTGVKSIDLSEQGTSLVTGTLKIQENKWLQLNYNYRISCPIYIPKEKNSQFLSKSVLSYLRTWAETLNESLVLFDGEVCDGEGSLVAAEEKPAKKKVTKLAGSSSVVKVFEVEIFESPSPFGATSVSEFRECSGSILFTGTVAGRAFLNAMATASEGTKAVRNDLIRSLVSRWEMHCDSLVEEPQGASVEPVLHEPPRRVFIKGGNSVVSLCDYLFPGDSVSDACQSAKELLDIVITDEDVDDSVEKWADPEEFRAPESCLDENRYEEIGSVKQSNAFQFLLATAVGLLAVILAYYVITSKR